MSNQETIKLLEKGKTFFLDNKIIDSQKMFEKVINLDPDNQEANKYLGLICLKSEKKKDAWKFMKVALDANMEDPESWILFIHSLFVAEKYDDAKKIILIAEKNNLKSDLVQNIKAEIERKDIQILSEIISKKKTDFEDSNKKPKNFNKFFSKKNDEKPHNYVIGSLHDLMNYRKYNELYDLSKVLIKDYPNSPKIWEMKGLSEMHLEKYKECLKSYLIVEDLLPPDNKVIKINIASAYLKLGRKKDAIKVLEDVLTIDPSFELAEDLLNSIDNKN
tara:strand:- start:1799 stop:2626 length:828 start_codon:yes stop_codon:yes gene_type:complete